MKRLNFFLFFLFYGLYISGQIKCDLSRFEKSTFCRNSILAQGLDYWHFEKDILFPINQSKARIEIRNYSYGNANSRIILQIQCYKDSVICKKYTRTINLDVKPPFSKEDSLLFNHGGNYYKWTVERIMAEDTSVCNLLKSLVGKSFFTLSNADSFKKEIVKKHQLKNAKSDPRKNNYRFNVKEQFYSGFLINVSKKLRHVEAKSIRYDDECGGRSIDIFGEEFVNLFSKFYENKTVSDTNTVIIRSSEM